MIGPVAALAALAVLAGCGNPAPADHAGSGGPAPSARSVCGEAFPGRVVLGWMPVTVSALRSYRYGGPVAHYPLAGAFAGLSGGHAAAWCVLRDAPDSSSLWGVAAAHAPRRALGITGPGEGRRIGLMDRPPLVP